MTKTPSINRRDLMMLGAAAGSLVLTGGLTTTAARAQDAAMPFANGINPANYVGGDGSYERYKNDGIRLGLIDFYP